MKPNTSELFVAPLWLLFTGRELLFGNAMELLRQIDSNGSISKAARAVPMSYKSAWDLIDRLNNISTMPLVASSIGGQHGGGTVLTITGKSILALYAKLEKTFFTHASAVNMANNDAEFFLKLMNGVCMKTTARNQIAGTIYKVIPGAVNSEIIVKIADDQTLTAIVTNDSVEELKLIQGVDVVALIKASAVILFQNSGELKTTAHNVLQGVVAQVRRGSVNAEVIVKLPSSKTVVAIVTLESIKELAITEGTMIKAVFNASQVILALSM